MKKIDLEKQLLENNTPALATIGESLARLEDTKAENPNPTKEDILAQTEDTKKIIKLLEEIYKAQRRKGAGRPKINTDDDAKITFACSQSQVNKIKYIAFYKKVTIKKLVAKIFENYIREFEEDNGKIGTQNIKL